MLAWQAVRAQSGGDAVDRVVVRTVADLRNAVQTGRRHLEIKEHLDLRNESISTSTYVEKPIYRLMNTTKSIRVRSDNFHVPGAPFTAAPTRCRPTVRDACARLRR